MYWEFQGIRQSIHVRKNAEETLPLLPEDRALVENMLLRLRSVTEATSGVFLRIFPLGSKIRHWSLASSPHAFGASLFNELVIVAEVEGCVAHSAIVVLEGSKSEKVF